MEIPAGYAGQRLDQALARLLPEYSRGRIQAWMRSGDLRIDGRMRRPRDPVRGGERVELEAVLPVCTRDRAEAIPLRVMFEDEHLLVIDKPAGLVVHPAAGNPDGTLLNALLHLDPALEGVPRSGIVHRLDKDTSGLLLVARSLQAHKRLVVALAAREIGRRYLAVVRGVPVAGGTVDAPIGRHPRRRTHMAVVRDGRPAVTHYRVRERFRAHAALEVRLETGRTHQIRVHLAHIRHPLLGDPVYGGRPRPPPGIGAGLAAAIGAFRRQALHAEALTFTHPLTGEGMRIEAPPPADLAALLTVLREDCR